MQLIVISELDILGSARLDDAQNWKEGFNNGLQQSRVIVYLLSAQSFATMNENILKKKEDNVLTEFEKGI
ncbi:hypothetical protein BJ742DRAFT_780743 [Cladochytrium replicatum]|nr:hypothetical protein BJ742DRAFT_780743 [Cladochytrium replicatum]